MSVTAVPEKAIQFLNESNRIEGINEIDYHDPRYQDPNKGHFGAFIISQQEGAAQTPLTHKMIRSWQALLGREQREHTGDHIGEEEIGHIRGPNLQKNVRIGKHIPPEWKFVPLYLQNFIEDVNADLRANHETYHKDDTAYARFAATYFLRFERIHPFGDGNGRTGRLLANYFAAYCGREILVFPSEYSMRNRYIEAHESDQAMTDYFYKRMQ
ncbi:MAG: Fic family protein [Simkania sp.]|nr:Fic family protein [Simkania sp.]